MSRRGPSALYFILGAAALVACAGSESPPGDTDAPVAATAALSVTVTGGGTVSSAPAGITCGADCSESYAAGTTVTLTATADAGSSFNGWSGGGCSGTADCTVTLAADTTVTATFVTNNALTVTRAGTGTGTITSNPAGIDCGSDCTEVYAPSTTVILTAVADASSTFSGWSGACTGLATCTVTMDQARAVTATFAINSHALDVARDGTGTGTVASSPAGIDCGADCTEQYPYGTTITLTATPALGSTFAGWTGGGCTGAGTCTVTLTAATTVTATFSINIESVTVMRAGSGTGTVTSSPAGINCGADCNEAYPFGTMVTLTATPAAGSTFAGWSGGGCTGTGTCVVTVDMAVAVTATFNLTQHTLTVTRAGTGTGTVSSTPAGINCGADCSEPYSFGSVVTLNASPAVGSTFGGWTGGGCTGTGPCVVTVNAATTVTATFTVNQYTLSVVRAGTGNGTVTSAPAGINCGADCAEVYNHGTVITLTATPAAGQSFTGWTGGGCTGTGTCAVTLTSTNTVTATFIACPSGTTTFNYTGGQQTFTVPACVTSITVDAYGAQGGTSTGESGGQNFTGGLGARARGTFSVTGGQSISVLVGGMGLNNRCGSGGGGGSFVVRSGAALVIAGGGGGGFHCNVLGGVFGVGGNTSTSGGAGVCTMNPSYPRSPTPGGTGGNGANAYWGGGGGGFLTAGTSTQLPTAGGGVYPGNGGVPGGGYGGGGGHHDTCCGGSGGGGGYSGGGGSAQDGCAGGGGGSINNGSAQLNTAATRSGNGTVIISY